jgi:hypothetical protein
MREGFPAAAVATDLDKLVGDGERCVGQSRGMDE